MAKGAYLGISDAARKVKSMYVGVDGVARKVKKAYIGDANGLARLCWSTGAPYISGSVTLSTYRESTITISGINFEPKYVFVWNMAVESSDGATHDGIYTTVPTTSTDCNGAIQNGLVSASFGTATFNNGTLTVSCRGDSITSSKFAKGTYYYIVAGTSENVLYGTKTVTSNATTVTIDLNGANSVKELMVITSGTSYDYMTYGVKNNRVYYADYNSEYGFWEKEYSGTKNYSVSNGVLTLNAMSATYKFGKGFKYLIITE